MSIDRETPLTIPSDHPRAAPPNLLEKDDLKQAAEMLAEETQARIIERQGGIGTFFDNLVIDVIRKLRGLDEESPWEESVKRLSGWQGQNLKTALERLRLFLARRKEGRFVDYQERFIASPDGPTGISEIGYFEQMMSQGVSECMQWKGLALFKTVYDSSIYNMLLWNLAPKTIIELGSGLGTSAVWLADLMSMFKIKGHVFSADLKKPDLQHEDVTFIEGDLWSVKEVLSDALLKSAPHPWLFIEDAHVNLLKSLCYFHAYFETGDYLIIEDSIAKRAEISRFVKRFPNCYKVDTYYTDFFGRNSTCANDSIFVRL